MPDIGAALQRKIGPLPAYAWLAVVGGGIFFARKIGSVDDAEAGEFDDSVTEDIEFPSSQLRPVVGEHMAEETGGPLTIPFPATGGIVIPAPGEEPIIIQPTNPAPLPGNNPNPGVPSFYWGGKRWFADKRGQFDTWIRRTRPLGYLNIREWIYGVNVPGGIKRKFKPPIQSPGYPSRPRKPTKGVRQPPLMGHKSTAKRMGWI